MPDPIVMLTAMGATFIASAVLLWICGRLRGEARTSWSDGGWVAAVGLGFLMGCWILGNRPHWPFKEDQDRLLGLVVPAVIVVELLAVWSRMPVWIISPLRLALVVGTAPVLLYGTSYISDVAGPGSREWSPSQAWMILGGLATALGAVWALLTLLSRRSPGLSLPVCLAFTSAAAGLTVMLSGYATGGQDGLPLAAAIMGASAAALLLPRTARGAGALGVPIVALFSLLVIGRFFGELTVSHAVLLFVAPLLAWLPELPLFGQMKPWARGLARVVLAGVLVSAVVGDAVRRFFENSRPAAGTPSTEPSLDDYTNFGR
jgi:hypothetical protein